MRFGTDTFNVIEDARTALLIAKNPIVTNFEHTHIDKFIIDYDQPTGTDIRFFLANFCKSCFKYSGGTFTQHIITGDGEDDFAIWNISSNPPSVEDVLEYGNTVAELLAISDVAVPSTDGETYKLRGNLYPVIALKTTKSAVPKVKFSIQFSQHKDITDKEDIKTFSHDSPIRIFSFTPELTLTGSATASLSAAYKSTPDGDYSAFDKPATLIDKTIYGMKIKYNMHVDKVDGSDKVRYKTKYRYTEDVECNSFGETADIYSITKNYYLPLKYCVVVVKHNELTSGAAIKAYAKLDPSINWKVYTIGTGTGSFQNYNLPVSKFIDVNNLHVYVNGVETTDYMLYVKDNCININAPAGATITASSNYNLKTEEWIELDADATQHDVSDGKFTTRYSSKITKSGVYVSAIRLRLFRGQEGNMNTLTLPITPNGQEQSYRFNDSDITLYAFFVYDPATSKYLYRFFNFDPQDAGGSSNDEQFEVNFSSKYSFLTFTVPAGDYQIIVKYYKNATRPIVYSWTAGYCVG